MNGHSYVLWGKIMLLKVIMRQTKFLLKQKEAVLTMIILLWLIASTYLENVLYFRGLDVSQMYHPMKLLTLSYNRVNHSASISLLLVMIYPILVTLPAGFAYVKEQQTKEEVLLMSRIGKTNYLSGKLWSAFFTTAIVFFIPFSLEIIMNCISFPLKAQCDLTNLSIYSAEYADIVHGYFGSSVYIISPILYALLGTVFFSILSGILGMLTVAVSFVFKVKYRVFLFLPNFLALHITSYWDKTRTSEEIRTSWYEYMLLFGESRRSVWYLATGTAVIVLLVFCLYFAGRKKERW